MTDEQLDALFDDMTIEEKIGQMIQVPPECLAEGGIITGPTGRFKLSDEEMALVGSVLSKYGADDLQVLQREQMARQPHHIPMLFMFDVINGFQTIFPIPLGLGSTFKPDLIEGAACISAKEASAEGIMVTFSPMLDLVRDARWGRVMESTGEDTWLNSQYARAWVRGYQGNDISDKGRVASCIKHFAAYGAVEGGRDYDNVELSERTLWEDYLPAYRAAVDAGCRMVMTSFNTVNRIPASGSRWLMRDVLREEMGFDGVLISDYSAIEEMVTHGVAKDTREAAKLAIEAGVDIDMVSGAYINNLVKLVETGTVPIRYVNDAVWRILKLKNDLGLFENPMKDADAGLAAKIILCDKNREYARQVAADSFVLLKNEHYHKNENILPLKSKEKVVYIGPYTDEKKIYGSWSFPENDDTMVTIKEGVKASGYKAKFAQGSYMLDEGMKDRFDHGNDVDKSKEKKWLKEALELAKSADKVVLCLGEQHNQTGEGGSRANITLPECQMELLRKVHKINKNIVTLVFTGRPLDLTEVSELSKAVVIVWFPGTEGGNAIADVLYGKHMPQGKLTMTFPRSVGQVPIYYNHIMTGRPNDTGRRIGYRNGYIDESCFPLYPFGYGLTYTKIEMTQAVIKYDNFTKTGNDCEIDIQMGSRTDEKIDEEKVVLNEGNRIFASTIVSNSGDYAGTETVQLYIRDVSASVVRPVKMLRGYKKIKLEPGEQKTVTFEITEDMLRFYDQNMYYVSEAGKFQVYIGSDSSEERYAEFYLEKESVNN